MIFGIKPLGFYTIGVTKDLKQNKNIFYFNLIFLALKYIFFS